MSSMTPPLSTFAGFINCKQQPECLAGPWQPHPGRLALSPSPDGLARGDRAFPRPLSSKLKGSVKDRAEGTPYGTLCTPRAQVGLKVEDEHLGSVSGASAAYRQPLVLLDAECMCSWFLCGVRRREEVVMRAFLEGVTLSLCCSLPCRALYT